VFTLLTLVAAVNGSLTWIGRGVGIHQLTLQLVLGYMLYPVTFFMGVPRHEILTVSRLIATKLVVNEFVSYSELKTIMASSNPLSTRTHTITAYTLCGFANIGSLGIQVYAIILVSSSGVR
jgi:CNT family concentrative nucleoside transporter